MTRALGVPGALIALDLPGVLGVTRAFGEFGQTGMTGVPGVRRVPGVLGRFVPPVRASGKDGDLGSTSSSAEEHLVRLAVVLIHGIGSQSPDFADPMIEELRERLDDRGHDPDDVAFQPLFWADLVAPRQTAYLRAAEAAGRLDYMPLRRYVVQALGDAAAYQYVERPSSTYVAIHDRIRALVRSLWVQRLGEQPVPMVAIAHSMGSHVLSSYVWDTQRASEQEAEEDTGAGPDASPFERFEHLAGIVTLGSNIPLFTFAYDPVTPIDFPGSALAPEVAAVARWRNYFDRDDVLGYPLRPIGPLYAEVVDSDRQVNVGGLAVSGTPLSHTRYWTDNDVTRPVADQLATLLDAAG